LYWFLLFFNFVPGLKHGTSFSTLGITMSDVVINGLLGVVGGMLVAVIYVWAQRRKEPSRLTTDAVSLVDASGQVISNLTDEINRLEEAVDDARREAREARTEALQATKEAVACAGRVYQLEKHLVENGITPPL
jgi:uncharacterized membrane protein